MACFWVRTAMAGPPPTPARHAFGPARQWRDSRCHPHGMRVAAVRRNNTHFILSVADNYRFLAILRSKCMLFAEPHASCAHLAPLAPIKKRANPIRRPARSSSHEAPVARQLQWPCMRPIRRSARLPSCGTLCCSTTSIRLACRDLLLAGSRNRWTDQQASPTTSTS